MKVQIFTLAFRKIREMDFPAQGAVSDIPFDLKDQWGASLSNGLYYLVVTTDQGRKTLKLLVLI